MRRSVAVIVAFSALLIGASALHAVAEEYVCPPGAKFCPAPGATQVADSGSFGLDSASSGSQFAMHQNQLNEGETLIMVAPSGGADMTAFQSGGMTAPVSYQTPMPTMSSPVITENYASAPASGGMPLDFIPPPPGSSRSSSSSSQASGGSQYSAPAAPAPSYATAPARQSTQTYQSAPAYQSTPDSTLAAAPARRAPRESVRVSGPAARAAADESTLTPSPDSFAQSRAAVSRNAYDDDDVPTRSQPKAKVAEKPAKKRRADMLSEVANETSRKSSKSDAKADKPSRDKDKKSSAKKDRKDKKDKKEKRERSDDDRVPWWKGGLWRNRNR